MPTFCRHNRFVDRCPICKQTLPGAAPKQSSARDQGASSGRHSTADASGRSSRARAGTRRPNASRRSQAPDSHLRVYADSALRGREDGYHCELVNGLHSSEDARRLCDELAFSNARLLEIATSPHGVYARARELCRDGELELGTWLCLLTAYLRPLEAEAPFVGIETVFDATAARVGKGALELEIDLADVPLGPRASHGDAHGATSLKAYLTLMRRLRNAKDVSAAHVRPQADAGSAHAKSTDAKSPDARSPDARSLDARSSDVRSSDVRSPDARSPDAKSSDAKSPHPKSPDATSVGGPLLGERAWSPQRRFERAFERLGMPGFNRACRFELLTILGALAIYDMSADSLHLAAAQRDLRSNPSVRGRSNPIAGVSREPVLDAAKRVFGIGDVINLERRAKQLAEACAVPLGALDLALYNWASPRRASAGVHSSLRDAQTLARSVQVLRVE